MAPDECAVAYDMADLLKGKIPHWHRGKDDSEPKPDEHDLD